MLQKEIAQLKFLKEKLHNQKMSVLVGAGFSKNASAIFPSWKELLSDMIYFLYETDIEDAWHNLSSAKKKLTSQEDFKDQKIVYYLRKIGYLDTVSEYIKRKGFREAITSYIEEKTPKLITEGKKSFLTNSLGGKINKVPINSSMLSQHKLLLQLPWNNIYTTNYDELLEISNDSMTSKFIHEEIITINKEIDKVQTNKLRDNKKLIVIKNQCTVLTNEIEGLEKDSQLSTSQKVEFENLKNSLGSKEKEKRETQYNIDRYDKISKDKEREVLRLKNALDSCISIVANASDLSIKRNKNIIKLHGSLRKNGAQYGFDGDIQKQYVIAKEDYETYPVKHEAFTQLMRISLLQESYCLIGFSGDDTNFLEWVKWVREILRREEKVGEDYKIYLIDVHSEVISEEKKLFFENHNIVPIQIMNDSIITALESYTGRTLGDRKKIKKVIELFLLFLRGKHQVNLPKATYEHLQETKYRRAWESLPSSQPGKISYKVYREQSKKILKLKQNCVFPSINFLYSKNKQDLLFYAPSLLENAPTKSDREALLKLIVLAVKDCYLNPIDFVWQEEKEKKIFKIFEKSPKPIRNEFLKIKLRGAVLIVDSKLFDKISIQIPNGKSDRIRYESLLLSAFQFDFEKLKRELDIWKPKAAYRLKKFGLLNLFDSKIAFEYIKDQLEQPENTNQEELYMLEVYKYVQRNLSYTFDKELDEAIKTYKNVGLISIYDNFDLLTEENQRNKKDLKRYGDGRFTISNSVSFSNDFTSPQKGVQLLQLLLDTGLPLSMEYSHLKDPEQCYPLFKAIFEFLPYPVIFYALQFSDQKFLRRLGQDFAYSDILQKSIPEILNFLLSSYMMKETPRSYKQNILLFSSELLIATNPLLWQKNFQKIWEIETFKDQALRDRTEVERIFVNSGLPYINNADILVDFLLSLLGTSPTNTSIEILYHLAKNPVLKRSGSALQNKELERKLNEHITQLVQDEKNFFILGNLFTALKDYQKKRIVNELKSYDFKKIKNERLWSVLVFFASGDKMILQKIKNAILKSTNLFNAGFKDSRTLSSGINFIELSKLSKSKNKIGISWNKKETIQIFGKIILELDKIEVWLSKRDHDFKFILHEMQLFLEQESSTLEQKPQFHSIQDRIKEIYYSHRGYSSLIDGLLSSDHSTIVWALSELSIAIHQRKSLQSLNLEITAFLNKVLIQSEPGLEASLNYLAEWMSDSQIRAELKNYKPFIIKILEKYTGDELESFDKPFVYDQLIKIATNLNKWGISTDSVIKWQKYRLESPFNNIKNGFKA